MIRMSRGSRVGSSSSRPRTTSRTTSTCRAGPWQACTVRLRSSASTGCGSATVSSVSCCCRRPSSVPGRGPTAWWTSGAAGSSCCSSRMSRDSEASSGLRLAVSVRTASHSAGEGCVSHRCRSRCSASASRTAIRDGVMRVVPKIEKVAGRSDCWGASRRRAHAASSSSAGRRPEVGAHAAPQLGLPPQVGGQRRAVALLVTTGLPRLQHRRTGPAVGLQVPRELGRDGEAATALAAARFETEVDGENGRPRLPHAVVDHGHQRPDDALGRPSLRGVGEGRVGRRDRVVEQPVRRREHHVGAHPVAVGRAQDVTELLGQPPLDPLAGHGDELGPERVGRRLVQQLAERGDERVRPFGAVDQQHPRPARRCATASILRQPARSVDAGPRTVDGPAAESAPGATGLALT